MHQATSVLPRLTAQGLSSANLTPKAPQFFLRLFVRVYNDQYLYRYLGVVNARGQLALKRFFKSFSSLSLLSFSIRLARHGLSILALLMVSVAAHASEFKIFSLQHRFASDLVPIVSPMVSEPGTVSAIDNQLIVRTDSATMREVEAIVTRLDIARINRKVSFKFNQDTQNQYANTEASGNVRIGKVTIGKETVGNQRRGASDSARVDIERHSTHQQRNSSQFLNVLDGENAFIRVGQQVPYTQEWVTYTRRYTQVQTTTDWQNISTGFAVRPNTIGHQVELVITPRISSLNGQIIDFAELNTVVRVNLGEWVNLGGTLQQNDEVSRKILGIANRQNTDNHGFWVKVD